MQRAAFDDRLKEEFHQSYPLAANGRVTLSNISGKISVVAGERNEVKVDAVKLAYEQERLAEARIEVEASADAVRIKTKYPEQRNMYFSDSRSKDADYRKNSAATVEYTLTVPRGAFTEVNSVSGDITIEGVTGELKIASVSGDVRVKQLASQTVRLSSVSGAVEAALERTIDGQVIDLNSVSGSVYLTLPSDANANVRGNTVSGTVRNKFGLPVRVGEWVGRDFAGQLGSGGARVKLNTVSGMVELRRANDGKPLSNVTSSLPRDDARAPRADGATPRAEAIADMAASRLEFEADMKEAQQELEVARKEFERERERYQAAQSQTNEDARREAREQYEEARREFDQAQREFSQAQREQQREMQRDAIRAQREAARARSEAIRESARASAEASRAAAELARGLAGDVYIGKEGPMLTEREERTLKIEGSPNINLHTDDGGIIVRAWDNPDLKVVFVKRARDKPAFNEYKLTAQQNGSSIDIRADVEKKTYNEKAKGWYYNGTVGLEVWLPRKVKKLKAHTGDGRIMLEGVTGELDLQTGDGSVDVLRGQGSIKVETGDGRINLSDWQGQANLKTGDGRISLSGNFEELSAATGDGNITYNYTNALNAIIEADCEDIVTNGSSAQITETGGTKKLTIGSGGKTFRFRTGDGKLYLQKEN